MCNRGNYSRCEYPLCRPNLIWELCNNVDGGRRIPRLLEEYGVLWCSYINIHMTDQLVAAMLVAAAESFASSRDAVLRLRSADCLTFLSIFNFTDVLDFCLERLK